MEHIFLTERWIARCVLFLSNVRLIDYLNAQKASFVIEEGDMDSWPPEPQKYQYKMQLTYLHPKQIILAHESGTASPSPKTVVYERRISRKIPPKPYEFHLKNGLIIAGNAYLKKDILNLARPFISVTKFRIGFHRPDDPRKRDLEDKAFTPFSGFNYIILNTEWISHFHRLSPHENLLWFPEEPSGAQSV